MTNDGPKSEAEVKDWILDQVRGWLEDPGNTQQFAINVSYGRSPQGQKMRIFTLKAEAVVGQATIGMQEPSIIVPNMVPPGGIVPPKGNQH